MRSAPPCRVQQAMRSACAGSSRGLLSSAVLHLYSKHADALVFRLTRRGANHRGTVSAERDAGRLQAARQDFWADHAASEARYHAGLTSPDLPRRTCLAGLASLKRTRQRHVCNRDDANQRRRPVNGKYAPSERPAFLSYSNCKYTDEFSTISGISPGIRCFLISASRIKRIAECRRQTVT